MLHRTNPDWAAPDTFDPDRFLPNRVATRNRLNYLPFGTGPRRCIGEHFSLMEMQLVLATIAQRYRLRTEPGLVGPASAGPDDPPRAAGHDDASPALVHRADCQLSGFGGQVGG